MQAAKNRFGIIGLLAAGLLCTAAAAHKAVVVGHDGKGNLHPHWHQNHAVGLPVSVFLGVDGWAAGAVGVEAAPKDEPDHHLFMLDSACHIRLIVVASDPGMQLYNEDSSAPVPVGGSYNLGQPYFHFHPVWNISEGLYGQDYSIQVKFHDDNGIYADSEVVTVTFTPACTGDPDLNGVVNVDDLLTVINGWGACEGCDDCHADLNQTCSVDVDDLLTVINAWGNCNK